MDEQTPDQYVIQELALAKVNLEVQLHYARHELAALRQDSAQPDAD